MSTSNTLPLNFNSPEAESEFRKTMEHLPEGIDVFIVGGALRNALFRQFHGTILKQRDYDQVITKGSAQYAKYLSSCGFEELPYSDGRTTATVFRKPLVKNAKENYHDWLVFDLHTVDGTTIEDNLQRMAVFSVNGCAVRANEVLVQPWQEAVLEVQALPTALQDIKDKKLSINKKSQMEPSSFFSALRLVSAGFAPPSHHDVNTLLDNLAKLEHGRFDRNVKKVWDYVGGEANARSLVEELGITTDVFNEDAVRARLRSTSTR